MISIKKYTDKINSVVLCIVASTGNLYIYLCIFYNRKYRLSWLNCSASELQTVLNFSSSRIGVKMHIRWLHYSINERIAKYRCYPELGKFVFPTLTKGTGRHSMIYLQLLSTVSRSFNCKSFFHTPGGWKTQNILNAGAQALDTNSIYTLLYSLYIHHVLYSLCRI